MRNHFYFAAIGCAVFVAPAWADTRDDVMAAMQRCSVMQDDRTWLECTYGAQQLMRAKLGLPAAPDYQQRLVPPAPARMPVTSAPAPALPGVSPPAPPAMASAPTPRRRGTFLQILAGTAPPVAVSPLAAVDYDARGAFTVTLQNGQVWRQVNGDQSKARFRIGEKITIQPGALQTYNLKTESNAHPYKVERRS